MKFFVMEFEAKIFCIILTGILYFFHSKPHQENIQTIKHIYLFTFTGIVLSILQDISATSETLFGVTLGLSYASLTLLWLKYIYTVKNCKTCILKTLSVFISAAAGFLAAYLLIMNINIIVYLSVLAVVVVYSVSQYNKIRIDNLTNLYNRYGLDEEIKEQLQQYAKNKNDSFYLIACDLDNFKHINDTWGHQEGDRALILISSVLSKVGKMYNSEVFRIGGDEFVIITDTSEEGLSLKIVEEIKNELDNIDFRNDFNIKMSMGIALYDGKTPVDELLNKADKKLYEAKKINKKI